MLQQTTEDTHPRDAASTIEESPPASARVNPADILRALCEPKGRHVIFALAPPSYREHPEHFSSRVDTICFRCAETGHKKQECRTWKTKRCRLMDCPTRREECPFAHEDEPLRQPWIAKCVRVVKQGLQYNVLGCGGAHTFKDCPAPPRAVECGGGEALPWAPSPKTRGEWLCPSKKRPAEVQVQGTILQGAPKTRTSLLLSSSSSSPWVSSGGRATSLTSLGSNASGDIATDSDGAVAAMENVASVGNTGDAIAAIENVASVENTGDAIAAMENVASVENTSDAIVAIENVASVENTGDAIAAMENVASVENTSDAIAAMENVASVENMKNVDAAATTTTVTTYNNVAVITTDMPTTRISHDGFEACPSLPLLGHKSSDEAPLRHRHKSQTPTHNAVNIFASLTADEISEDSEDSDDSELNEHETDCN